MTITCRFDLATNKQLMTILRFDNTIPTPLLDGLVNEALRRGLFDKPIISVINYIFKGINKGLSMDFDDLMQIGRIGVCKAVSRFETGKCSFFTFAYLRIKSEICHELQRATAKKRGYNKTLSTETEVGETATLMTYLPDKVNVEEYVIRKVLLEERMKMLSKHQRAVVELRSQGYKFCEIAEILGKTSISADRSLSATYGLAIKRMRVRGIS